MDEQLADRRLLLESLPAGQPCHDIAGDEETGGIAFFVVTRRDHRARVPSRFFFVFGRPAAATSTAPIDTTRQHGNLSYREEQGFRHVAIGFTACSRPVCSGSTLCCRAAQCCRAATSYGKRWLTRAQPFGRCRECCRVSSKRWLINHQQTVSADNWQIV